MTVCKTLNLIHKQKSRLDLTNEAIARAMSGHLGESVSKESVGHYFTHNSGVPLEKLGAFLNSLGLKVVEKNSPDITLAKLRALEVLAREALSLDDPG